jgi:hypothetical protein
MMGDDGNTGRGWMMKHTTCPQSHKQLLMGWITGGSTTTTREEDKNNNNEGGQ